MHTRAFLSRRVPWIALATTLLCALPETSSAQAGLSPLSTAKLRVPSADPVPEGRLELGLHYQMGWSHRHFTEEGRLAQSHALDTDALLGVRLTYGVVDQRAFGMEIGALVPVVFRWGEDYDAGTTHSAQGLGNVPLGVKLRILQERDWSLALALVGEVPTGDRNQVTSGYGRVGGGLLLSARLVEGLTLDFVFQGDGAAGLRDPDRDAVAAWGLETSIALAWVERRGFFRVFTPCLELGHRVEALTRGDPEGRIRHRLGLNVGFAIQLTKRVLMTQAAQVDLAGANQPMGAGWIMNTAFLL